MNKFKIYVVLFLCAQICEAYPLIFKIENPREHPLWLTSERDNLSFAVRPKYTIDALLCSDSDWRVKYATGATGTIFWNLNEEINSFATKCNEMASLNVENSNLPICSCSVGQHEPGKIWTSYFLQDLNVLDSGIKKDTFLTAFRSLREIHRNFLGYNQLKSVASFTALADLKDKLRPLSEESEVFDKTRKSLSYYLQHFGSEKIRNSQQKHILFFGDQGTGNNNARQVARDMRTVCALHGCDFALSSGDNIYPAGVSNLQPHWEAEFVGKFVDIFISMWDTFKLPFYMTLGNHDVGITSLVEGDWKFLEQYRGKFGPEHYQINRLPLMHAQQDFTLHKSNPTEGKKHMWNMPESFYAITKLINNVETLIVVLDTNNFPGSLKQADRITNEKEKRFASPDFTPYNNLQLQWLQGVLKSSNAKWKIVMGHHAMYSIGRHGVNMGAAGFYGTNDRADMEELRKILKPVLCDNNVHFYLAGHDHHLEINAIKCGKGKKIIQIISGAAGKTEAESPWKDAKITGSYAFTVEAMLPEFVWGNGLNRTDIEKKAIPLKMLGFSTLKIERDQAGIHMIQSTKNGPKLAACFTVNQDRSGLKANQDQCNATDDFSPLFMHDIAVIPSLE